MLTLVTRSRHSVVLFPMLPIESSKCLAREKKMTAIFFVTLYNFYEVFEKNAKKVVFGLRKYFSKKNISKIEFSHEHIDYSFCSTNYYYNLEIGYNRSAFVCRDK